MLIGIHDQPGSPSDISIAYCEEHGVPYRLVDCFANDIIEQLRDCDGLLWWWGELDPKARLFALQLTLSLEAAGKSVFPNSATCWHFDDKLGQKYIFEACQLPLVPTHVFYDRDEALAWADNVDYPKVFKLRSGSGSKNVWLVRNPRQAKWFIKRAFGRGFAGTRRLVTLEQRLWHLRRDQTWKAFWIALRGVGRVLFPETKTKLSPRESGYAYFQDFIPDKNQVFFIHVIDGRAYAVRTMVHCGDFRASGSGLVDLGRPRIIPEECIELAFRAADLLGMQFVSLEMLVEKGKPLIIECDQYNPMETFLGFWDRSLRWHEEPAGVGQFIIEKFLQTIEAHGTVCPLDGAPRGTRGSGFESLEALSDH